MRRTLTQNFVDTVEAPRKGRKEIYDIGVPGLVLRVTASGTKSWCLTYRLGGGRHGLNRRLTIGGLAVHPDLDKVREIARTKLIEIENGRDPAAEKHVNAIASAPPKTFLDLAEKFIADYAQENQPRSWKETERVLNKVAAQWGYRDLHHIADTDVIALLDNIRRKTPIAANRVHQHLGKLFRWARAKRYFTGPSPMTDIERPAKERSRAHVLTDDEIRWFWRACGDLGYPFGPMFKLLLVTGQRRSEVAAMAWAELDLVKRIWTIPGERAKNGLQHVVPLSPLAMSVIEKLPHIGRSPFVFPGRDNDTKPATGYAYPKATIDRLMEAERRKELDLPEPVKPPPVRGRHPNRLKVRRKPDDGLGIAEWRLHDLRRTFATQLQRLGVRLEVTEAVLNHISGSRAGIVGIYQRHKYEAEKEAVLAQWGRHLAVMVGEVADDDATVVEFTAAARA